MNRELSVISSHSWLVSLVYWIATRREFSFHNIWNDVKNYRFNVLIIAAHFDLGNFEEVKKEIEEQTII